MIVLLNVNVELIERLNEPGQIESCSGTRTLMHNIADLKAQIAANLKVISCLVR
jgi:N-methylhydantoinase B/oxoprolinase/acetone carboxylase alpha subunit